VALAPRSCVATQVRKAISFEIMRAQKTTKRAGAAPDDPLVTVRLPASLFMSVKAWAKRGGMSRSAAVRSLLELGLLAASSHEHTSKGAEPKTRRPSARAA
jgi:predicted DNA binding CopG/RHH family protein